MAKVAPRHIAAADAPERLTPLRQWLNANGISASTGYRELAAGRLRGVKVGRRSYIRDADAAAYIRALPQFVPAKPTA